MFETRVAAQRIPERHQFQLSIAEVAWVPDCDGKLFECEIVVCSCIPCNTRKGNRLPREAHMSLIRKPKRPKWRPFVQITFAAPQHDLWKHFVDLAYWNVELSD